MTPPPLMIGPFEGPFYPVSRIIPLPKQEITSTRGVSFDIIGTHGAGSSSVGPALAMLLGPRCRLDPELSDGMRDPILRSSLLSDGTCFHSTSMCVLVKSGSSAFYWSGNR